MTELTLPQGLTARPPTFDDIPALVALYNRRDRPFNGGADIHSEEQTRSEWTSPQFDVSTQARLIERDGAIVGYVEVMYREPWVSAGVWTCLDRPLYAASLEHALLAWGEGLFLEACTPKAADAHQLSTHTWTFAGNTAKIAAITAAGYTHKRSYYRMMITLAGADIAAPTLPEGYTFRHMRLEDDDQRAVYGMLRTAFRDHFGHIERDFETGYANWLHEFINAAHFDPALVWVVDAPDGSVAGATLNWDRLGPNTSIGWVDTLGVAQAHRRKGIASALLLKSFRQFADREYTSVGLGVDADSITGATRVYKRVGMVIDNETRVYEKIHRAGEDIRRNH